MSGNETIQLHSADKSEYDSRACAGVALIFHHEVFRRETLNTKSNKDRDRLKRVLKSFGFTVHVHNNVKSEKLATILKEVASEDHTNNDCLVVVVMSHGEMGRVYAKDKYYNVECLWEPFLGDKCPSLINKPKLFFIQAGREGEDQMNHTQLNRSSPFNREECKINYVIPTTADLLIFYSTFEGCTSASKRDGCGWFIQSLCTVLEKAATTNPSGSELLSLLTAVSREVAQTYTLLPNGKEIEQMPTFVSTLTKTFYLKVKKCK